MGVYDRTRLLGMRSISYKWQNLFLVVNLDSSRGVRNMWPKWNKTNGSCVSGGRSNPLRGLDQKNEQREKEKKQETARHIRWQVHRVNGGGGVSAPFIW